MRLFVESGCLGNVIGFESLDIENLRQMRKGPNLAAFDRYAGAVAALRAHHLQTWAAFALGYDHDTVESILATCEWGIANRFTFAAFNVLMPYPVDAALRAAEGRGSAALRRALVAPSRLPLQLRRVPPGAHDRRRADRGRLGLPAALEQPPLPSFERALDPGDEHGHRRLRFALYCAYNPLYRREAFKRQGMRLGVR